MFLIMQYAMMRNPTTASQKVGSSMRCFVHMIALDVVPPIDNSEVLEFISLERIILDAMERYRK